MRVLVIPDIHLKPRIFKRADEILKEKKADRAVCLMDIADDWGQGNNIALYEDTYDAAISFARKHQDCLWCFGNHDLSYIWKLSESGYSSMAATTVLLKLLELLRAVPKEYPISYIYRIDDVLFSHGGLCDIFVKQYVKKSIYNDIDKVISTINCFGQEKMWYDLSPIWLRPQLSSIKMYKPRKLLQVVGHTPVMSIEQKGNIISCDNFSTYRDGTPIGTEEFLIIDTISWEKEITK